jgi:SAM-dependent methyltransferase
MSAPVDYYSTTYGSFSDTVMAEIRRETYGEDIGQNSWLTADEMRQFIVMLRLTRDSRLLEIASGSGGPAIFIARTTSCDVTGVDINENGIANANRMAADQHIQDRARFQHIDAGRTLPFSEGSFDALICIDSINHLPDRTGVLRDRHRIVKPGGHILFTDPIVVTGILTNEEMAIRSSIGFFLFVPPGENERLLNEHGFQLIISTDVTANEAMVSKRRRDARQRHRAELLKIEDENTFEGTQRFLEVVYRLSSEQRLSRIAYLARSNQPSISQLL